MSTFEKYKKRKIDFLGAQYLDGWHVKVYTITKNDSFRSGDTLNTVLKHLKNDFIVQASESKILLHYQAFLVVHEARDGVWILFSWWTQGEMLETITRFAFYESPLRIDSSPHSGSLVCIWELEVFIHERAAWIQHVLQRPDDPDFFTYQNDGLYEN